MAEPEEKEVAASDKDADLPIPDILPVLPLKDVVVFPFIILPLSVSREKSINAVDAALAEQRIIMLVAQKDAQNDSPRPDELYTVGTVAAIMRMLKLPDGRIRLLVQGLSRARLDSALAEEPFIKAKITRTTVDFLAKVLAVVSAFLPDISQFQATADIERGVSMPWGRIGSAGLVVLSYGLPVMLLAYLILKRKEVAP